MKYIAAFRIADLQSVHEGVAALHTPPRCLHMVHMTKP